MELVKNIGLELQKIPSWAKNLLIIVSGSIVLSLFANVAFFLPFTTIPISTQPAVVTLMAVLLGPKRAVGAVALFLAQGAVGLPVFAGGMGGIAILMGTRGGYLLGYLIASFVVAKMIDHLKGRTLKNAFIALLTGDLIILSVGAAWLATFIGFQKALLLGVVPFLLGDAVKMVISLKILNWMGWGKQ